MVRAPLQIRAFRRGNFFALDDTLPETHISSFLIAMDRLMPWSALGDLVAPYLSHEIRLSLDDSAETLLRVFFLQRWFGLSAEEVADGVADSIAMARFVGFQNNAVRPGLTQLAREFERALELNDLPGKLERLSEACLAGNQCVLVKGWSKAPGLQPVRRANTKLKALDSCFATLEPPYGLADIFRFNSIYRDLYPNLSAAERQQAEQYVDMLVEGVEDPTLAAKIYGVV